VALCSPAPWALFAFQTLWQFPHFYIIAWLHREDYARGGFKMFPMTMTGEETAALIKPYFAALMALPVGTWLAGATAPMFMVDIWVLTALFYRSFYKFEQKPTNASARKLFLSSLWYLFGGFGALILHSSVEERWDWRERMRSWLREFCVHASVMDDLAMQNSCWMPKESASGKLMACCVLDTGKRDSDATA
jgi:protoheme IX farnesyltransferase